MSAERMDPRAAACVRRAVHHHERGNFERAAHWYGLARNVLGDHREVLFNLAATSVRAHRYADAQKALKALGDAMRDQGGSESMRYASRYNRILAEHHVLEGKVPSDKAKAQAKKLCIDLLEAVAGSPPSDERDVLKRLEGAATSLLAWLKAHDDDDADAGSDPMTPDALLAMLKREKYSSAALETFAREHHSDDRTTLYNLACCEIAHEDYTVALRHLGQATEDPLLKHLAEDDGRLAGLQKERPEEVRRLLARPVKRKPLPIGRLVVLATIAVTIAVAIGVGVALVGPITVLIVAVGVVALYAAFVAGRFVVRRIRILLRQPRHFVSAVTIFKDTVSRPGHVVRKLRAERARRRETTSEAAFAWIASSITDLISGLVWLVTGSPGGGRDADSLVPRREALQGVFSVHGLDTIGTGEAGTPAWDDVIEPRLSVLLRDPVWPGLAVHALEVLERRQRRRVGEWSGSMRGRELAAVLGRAEQLTERLTQLRGGIRRRDDAVTAVVDQWAATLAEAISLREDLMGASRARAGDVPMFRTAVPERYREELASRAEAWKGDRSAALSTLPRPLREARGPR